MPQVKRRPLALSLISPLYLNTCRFWLARIGQGLDRLGPKRGVLLVQLPPSAAFDHPRFAYFLERVPRGLRICVEFRNPTWLQDSTFRLLEEHGAAYCVMSGAGLPCVLRATA
jgi:uncharacterized protein YecE (DUF72 family)